MTDSYRCPLCGIQGDVKDSYTGYMHYICPSCKKEWFV